MWVLLQHSVLFWPNLTEQRGLWPRLWGEGYSAFERVASGGLLEEKSISLLVQKL